MKKNYLSLLTLAVAAISGLTARAYDFTTTSGDVTTYFNLIDEDGDGTYDYAEITNDGTTTYGCYSGDYRVSSRVTYDGVTYPIKSIGASAFRKCTGLTSITLTGMITKIDEYAFYQCTALTELDLDWGNLESIGNYAFYGCTSLKSVTFGSSSSVATIGNRAFYGCTSLGSVEVPESVTSLGTYVFFGCTALTSAKLSAKITTIPDYTFQNCSTLVSVELPEGITEIGVYAFKSCVALTSFVIPTTVTTVGLQAFFGCTGLTELTFPYGVTAIKNSVCRNCSSLTTIRLPETVTTVGTYIFKGCTSLTAVYSYATSPATNTSNTWFEDDVYSSATLYVPSGSKDTYAATDYWSSFTTITELSYDGTANGLFFNITDETNLYAEVTNDGSGNYNTYCGDLTVPETVTIDGSIYTVTGVGASAFRACTSYLGVTLPSTIETIGSYAFYLSSGLEEITLPSSVTSLGIHSFRSCTGLTSISLNEGLTSIGISAFSGCTSLTDIALPSTLTTIGNYAFGAATGSRTVTACDAPALTSLVIPNSVTSLGTYICYKNTALESITLPENDEVTTTNSYLCSGCTSLKSVEIPATYTTIGTYAFYQCTGLAEVTFNEGLATVSTSAFNGCSALTELTLPESLTSVANNAFYNCTGLTKITAQSLTAPSLQSESAFSDYDVAIYVPLTSADAYAELGFTNINEYAYLTGDFNDWTAKDENYLMLTNSNGDWYTVVPVTEIAGKKIDIMLNSTNYLCYGGTAEEGAAYALAAATESTPTTVSGELSGDYAAVNIIKTSSDSSEDTYSLVIGTTSDSNTTGISDLASDGRTVVSEKFYNIAGAEVAEPTNSVKSIYVVVKTYDDGTVAVAKEVR